MQQNEVPKSLVEQEAVRATAYLSEDSWLSLGDFCEKLGAIMHLPDFVYDGENVYEWGFVQIESGSVEINISCLNEPDLTQPVDYVLSLMVSKNAAPELDKNWLDQNLLPKVASGLEQLREAITI